MEPDKKKKIAAAVAGVVQYMAAARAQEDQAREAACAPQTSLWAIAGRQAAMQMRSLMQMRLSFR